MTKTIFTTLVLAVLACTGFLPSSATAVAPVVTSAIPDTTVAEDAVVDNYRDLNNVFFDVEDGDSLAFAIQSNSNPGLVFATIDGDSALDLGFAPNATGAATLVVRATDAEALFAEDTLVVTVTPVNDAPTVVSAIPDTMVRVDAPPVANYVDLNDVFSDVEDGSGLTFSIQGNSDPTAVSVTIDADSALDLSFFPDTNGEATIVVRARDSGGLFIDATFVVTVHRTLWLLEPDGSGHAPTIQAAVNLTLDGDTILLADGTYTGGGNRGISLDGKEILITSENGPEVTIIDAQGADRVFIMDNVGPGGILSNITIRNGSKNQGPCIKMSNASPTISGMILAGNTAGKEGGAIYCDGGSSPTITHCVLIGNSAGSGGGIYAQGSSPVIENCTIVENSATSRGAGIYMRDPAGGFISNTIIAFNTQGVGLACSGSSNFTVSCTDIYGNQGGDAICGFDGGGNFSADPRFCGPPGSGDVYIEDRSPCAPGQGPCGGLIGALPVACTTEPDLVDTPNTLYPDVTFAGEPGLVVHVGLDNFTVVGVMLDTTSTVTFSDSAHSYLAALANPTYVPGDARNFTATFSPAVVPADIQRPATYALGLQLVGVDDSSAPYTATITTTGRNSILVDTPKIVLSAVPLRVQTALPGARNVPLLSLSIQNGYADERSLDSLVVTNMTFGGGTPTEIDAEIENLFLFDDVDSTGTLSGPDTLVAQSVFNAGRAVLAVEARWSVAALGRRNLFVTADIDSTLARDPDEIDVAVTSPSDVVFQGDTVVKEDFSPLYPLDSFGYAAVNGMAGHQVGMTPSAIDTLWGDTRGVCVLTLVVPQNGYETDTFTALSIKDYAGDFSADDIASLRLFRDDGDGTFDLVSDGDLGKLVYSGDRYEISGLAEDLSPPARFFIVADIARHAADGHHFRPGVPLDGIEVTSSNDGPVDGPAVSSKTFTFENPEVVEVTPVALAADAPKPGAVNVRLLLLTVENRTNQPVTLDSLTLSNGSTGMGTPEDLDNTFAAIRVYRDDGDGVVESLDTVLADDLGFNAGSLTAAGFSLEIATDETVHLLVTSDIDSFCAADGDTLQVRVNVPEDVGIEGSYPVVGDFPAVTAPLLVVDGMRAFQIAVFPGADSLIVTGGANVLLLDLGIPANGYASDILQTLMIRNEGSATSEHFDRIALYADGGNGVYDAGLGDDSHLGDLVENPAEPGRSFLIAGLALPLTAACGTHTRLYAAAEIAQDYTVAGTIRFSVPVMGIRVASGNEGPIDVPVVEPSMALIPKPDRLTVFPYPVGDVVVFPGSKNNLNSGIGFYNGYINPLTLREITFYQVGTASSGEIDSVFVYSDSDADGLFDPATDARVAAIRAEGVSYVFDSLDVGLEPRKISYLFVTYDLPLSVTDASTVDLRLFGQGDIAVEPPGSLIEGDFPINSPGTDVVDGMVSGQIAVGRVTPYNAARNDTDILALNLVVPPNGIWVDALAFVTVENQGTAAAGTDIAHMRVWREAGGDPTEFDPGEEDPLDYLDWNGSSWKNLSPIGVQIPTSGLRIHVTFAVSSDPTDGATVVARLPLNGLEVSSGNDGPIDNTITNATQQTISTDPLIATFVADRWSYTSGQSIVLSMTTRNEGVDTLYGVHPSVVAVSGSGSASVSSTPSPAALDLAPGSTTTFAWTYSAGLPGEVTFCGHAYSGDSLAVSEETCAETVLIQSPPSGVSVALTNLAPSTANRGQDDVRLFKLDTRYATSDTLAAPIRLTGFRFRFEDASQAPLVPNAVLNRILLVNPKGAGHAFSVADSTRETLDLTLPQSITLVPGGALTLNIGADISDTAAFTSFSLEIESLDDVRISDSNDGTAVAKTTDNMFPWATTLLTVNSPAESLLVDSQSGAAVTVNIGQENVRVFTIDLSHPGNPNSALVILNDLRFEFFDLDGTAVTPGSVVKRFRVTSGPSVLFDDDVVSGATNSLNVALKTPLVLSPGQSQAIDIAVDLKSLPLSEGFRMVLPDAKSLVARDINTGEVVRVASLAQSIRDFPFSSDLVVFQDPASGLIAANVNRLPSAILPSTRGIPVMDITLTHGGEATASSVRIDSLALVFSLSSGAPAPPGDYFSAVVITHRGDTVSVRSSLSSVLPLAECRLHNPVVIMPSQSETLSVFIDAKASFSPATIVVRTDQQGFVVSDVNDGARIFGIAGPFPLVAGPTSLQLPSQQVFAGLVSRIPANVTAHESEVEVFDFVVRNGGSVGSTPVEFDGLRVVMEGTKGSTIDPTRIANRARLVTRDSTVVDGEINSAEIVFGLPDDLVYVASGTSDTVSVVLDLDAQIGGENFRLVIEGSPAIAVSDAVGGNQVPVGTIGNTGYPLKTGWAHVLGGSVQTAYTNYPNPFAAGREQTTITYYLEQKSTVILRIYTLWGAPVVTLVNNKIENPGLHQNVKWDGRNGDGDAVNNGVYYLVLEIRGENGKNVALKRKIGVIR